MNRPIVAITLLWTAGYAIAASAALPWLSLTTSLLLSMAVVVIWLLRFPGYKAVCGLILILIAAGYYADYDRRNSSDLSASLSHRDPPVTETSLSLSGTMATPVEVDGDKATFTLKSDEEGGEQFVVNVKLLTKEEQDAAKLWQRGDHATLRGTAKIPEEARNFDGFDYRKYLRLKHIHWQITVKGAGELKVQPPESWTWYTIPKWNDSVRERLARGVERLFPEKQAGFMKGMLIGLTDDLDPLQFQQFSQLGLTHIIAISGLNVAIFLGCLIWIMRRVGFTRETYLLTGIAMMPLYIAITGASPSIIRAGLMAMISLYAAYRHTLKDGLHVVLLVGLAMLIWDPYYLLDVSFQLSFLVTIGLILAVPPVNRMLPIRPRAVRDSLGIALVAQAISFPVSIYYFNQFSLLSLAANLLLVPLFSMIVMPAGTAAMLIELIYLPAGQFVAWVVAKVNSWIFAIVDVASRWDAFQTIWRTPGFGWITCYYGLGALLLYGFHLYHQGERAADQGPMLKAVQPFPTTWRSTERRTLMAACLVALAFLGVTTLLFQEYYSERWNRFGEVDFIDVGQGDSILIRSPVSRSVVLIDGGGTVTFRKPGEEWKNRKNPYEVGNKLLVPLLKKRGIQQIDYLIVSHQDADHIGGLQAVLEQIPVKQVVFNGTFKPGPSVEKLFQTALSKGALLVKAYAGDTLDLDDQSALHILSPSLEEGESAIRIEKEQNGASIVFLMNMQGSKWLFTGDIDQNGEAGVLRLLERNGVKMGGARPDTASDMTAAGGNRLSPIDVLKIAHHGSKSSSSAAWLDAWQPRLAVISVGEHNVYGHPSPQVTDRLREREIGVLRTDQHGEIQMRVMEGGKIQARNKLQR